jgi:SAM-dependent methyltransferase
MTIQEQERAGLAIELLACPLCHGRLAQEGPAIRCQACAFRGSMRGGVFIAKEFAAPTYFDDKHAVMSEGKHDAQSWEIFYREQVDAVSKELGSRKVVVDVGCGPQIPYRKGADVLLIGVDPSFESLLANKSVDLPVYGSSDALPLRDKSVDLVLCFYSVHHMTGETLIENVIAVDNAFREFGRVVRPGGSLLVFDLSPWWPGAVLGNAVWNLARRILGKKLDMYFWRASALRTLGQRYFPQAQLTTTAYNKSMFSTFSPVFSLPRLRVPRFLYPFDINLYRWDFPRSE